MKIEDKTKEVTSFTESTKKQARFWDWLGRLLPMIGLATVAVLHYSREFELRDLVLDGILISFLSICFVWWYWAIIKIVSSTKYLQETYTKFKELSVELRNLKKDFKKDDSNR